MYRTLSSNRITAVVGTFLGLLFVGYPLLFGPVEPWSIASVILGVLLILASIVVYFSGSPPRDEDLHHRGGGV